MPRWEVSKFPVQHKTIVLGLGLLIGGVLLWPHSYSPNDKRVAVALDKESWLSQLEYTPTVVDDVIKAPDFEKEVVKGDTLSGLFEEAKIDQKTLYQVLEADLNVLALDTLMPGNTIQFWLNDKGQLQKLEVYFSPARQVIFTRFDDVSFNVKEVNIDGIWQNRTVKGDIQGSFYLSASKMGLNASEIQRIEALLKDKINFARDLRAGDKFSVLLSDQFIEGQATGSSHILAIDIHRGSRDINAFRYTDGNFYDDKGRSLQRAFQRIPLKHNYRISSRFNPRRLHPVTGRIAPHNGTDFATPIGTKVIAPGDGVVTMVTNHPYAGKYIVVDYGSKYRTRFLHLSKALVHKGQKVTRGQVIALTGNTGRITGPHLHYEFLINGRAVDAMKAKIPMSKELSSKDKKAFVLIVDKCKKMMG
ncbi:peptidoglycan DD-metalloendopeptidase family protein [uncultured Shewanella sp.]|uniref:peptidoglycan DD-metalloendopeptidase family protein n=1 Tax=uncultured Shewanella sp. TaxID=173975 RepID=UPI002612AC58|nr:peptidoglycan DD-metalloendopeptidase family protein [uncultured Shewanella sp.]